MARPSSVLCPSCGTLVGVNDAQCLNCGRRNPGMWGLASLLRNVGDDMGFTMLILWACGALYLACLVVDPEGIRNQGLLSFLSPSGESLLRFGASGAWPVFGLGRWWTFLSAGWLHGSVLHILAISGQHLVVLAFFLWIVLRFFRIRGRWIAAAVALFLLGYALLTGGQPPVVRAVVVVCALYGGLLLRRPALPANNFALAWLTVAALNPALRTFIGNALSVALTTWPLMPLAIWAFHAWLFPEHRPRWLVTIMPVVLVLCYLIEIAVFWHLL